MKYDLKEGHKVGRWTLIKPTTGSVKYRPYWECACICGKTGIIQEKTLILEESQSCGCLRKEMAKKWGTDRFYKHGLSRHPLFKIWDGMLQRCTNPKANGYDNYGGRGVYVCEEWASDFKKFYEWAIKNGWERGLDIDKDIKGNGLIYGPGSCCFVDRNKNMRATSRNVNITFNGETKCITDWAAHLGIHPATLSARLFKNKWPMEVALTKEKCTKYADRVKTR